MIKNKKLKSLLFILIFISQIEINNAVELGDYDSGARAAVVIPYGKSRDGETYILFAHEKARAGWTTPGGKREASHRTILDTAASELYEETAAFPSFNPTQIKKLLKKQDASCVFNLASSNTDYFALNIGDKIDQCNSIAVNYQQRIAGRPHCFNEMDQWKPVNVKDLYVALESRQRPIRHRLNIPSIGVVRGYVFNGLWQFYRSGLKNVIDTSIAPVAIPVITPAPAPVAAKSSIFSNFFNNVGSVKASTPAPVAAKSSIFSNLFNNIGSVKASTSAPVAAKSSIFANLFNNVGSVKAPTPAPIAAKSSIFANLFNNVGSVKAPTPAPIAAKSSIFANLFNNIGSVKALTPAPVAAKSSIFANLFNNIGSVKASTPAPVAAKSSIFSNLFNNVGSVKTSTPVNQTVRTPQTNTIFSLLKLLNK